MSTKPLQYRLSQEKSAELGIKPGKFPSPEESQQILREMLLDMPEKYLPGDMPQLLHTVQKLPFFTVDLEESLLSLVELSIACRTLPYYRYNLPFLLKNTSQWTIESGFNEVSESLKIPLIMLMNALKQYSFIRESVLNTGLLNEEEFERQVKDLWRSIRSTETTVILKYEEKLKHLIEGLRSQFEDLD